MTSTQRVATNPTTRAPRLYRIPEAMRLLSLSRSVIYEQIASRPAALGHPGPHPAHPRHSHHRLRRATRARSRSGDDHTAQPRRRRAALGRRPTALDRQSSPSATPRPGSASSGAPAGAPRPKRKTKLKELIRDHDDGLTDRAARLHRRRRRHRLARPRPQRPGPEHRREAADPRQRPRHPRPGRPQARELSAEDVDRWLAEQGADPQLQHRVSDQVDPAPDRSPGPGPGQGQTQRRAAVRDPDRSGRTAVEGADPRPGPGARRAGQPARRCGAYVCGLPAHRRAHRGAAGADLEPRRPRRRPDATRRCCRTSWSGGRSAPAATPRPGRRGAPSPCRSRCVDALREHRDRQAARPRARQATGWTDHDLVFATDGRHRARRRQRPARLPSRRRRRRPRRRRLDAPRAAAQLRLAAVRRGRARSSTSPAWSATPADRRSPRPSTASSCGRSSTTAPPPWTASSRRPRTLVTQLVTHAGRRRAERPGPELR